MQLPPLNAVRAFECVGRHGSMRRAAEELFVTPGAVSQQVRLLEEYFGQVLFDRTPRALVLTSSGQEFFSAASRHLRGIAQAAERVRPGDQQIALTVAPDFASRWLMPRLSTFAARYPKVEVRIDATFAMADFDRDPFDLGIRSVFNRPVDLHTELLLRQRVRPYCSPEYLARHIKGKASARAWAQARLLHESHPYDLWAPWFAMRGFTEPNAEVGLYFSHGLLAILAAIDSEGVTLQPPEYVSREVKSGSLVPADARLFESGLSYYLVWPKRPLKASAEAFKDWILDIVRKTTAAEDAIPRKPV
jgi:LysR family glycine cleavage system transcriptional activator